MTVRNEMDERENFDNVFRKWAERPPATNATDAARAVVECLRAPGGRRQAGSGRGDIRRAVAEAEFPPLDSGLRASDSGRRVRLSPAWATVVAAALALAAGTVSFIRSLPPVAGLRTGVATGLKTGGPTGAIVPARDADVVLWLDEGTPVYVFLPGDGQAMR